MATAADWLRRAAPQHDRWLLFVDEFDPHEPFDTPAPWLGRYEDEPWDDDLVIWPPYVVGGGHPGLLTEAEGRHVRANYGAKLSMIDHWFGEMVAALDDGGLWDDTAVIVCTDHGHYLGDVRAGDDIWGKPGVPQYEPLGHMPLLVHWPGAPGGGTCDALTTSVDLHATLADVFGVEPAPPHPRALAGPAADGRRRRRAGVGDRRGVRQLGPGHRRAPQVRPGAGRGEPRRCPCGRTGGRRCRCTSRAWTTCRCPTTGRSSTSCRGRRCR